MALYSITSDDGDYHERETRKEACRVLESLRDDGKTGVEIHTIK